MPAHSAAAATSARAPASASGAQGPAELRPLLEAQGRAGRKGGAALSGADAAGQRPFLRGHGRLRTAAVLLAQNHAQGLGR